MKTIKMICINPAGKEVCYTNHKISMNEFFRTLHSEKFNSKSIRLNITSDFDTAISGELTDDTFTLYGKPYSGKTYITNVNLDFTELTETKTTLKRIKENISW